MPIHVYLLEYACYFVVVILCLLYSWLSLSVLLFFFGFSSHTGTEICRKKGLVEHYFCFIVVILVKWKWRICLISAYFVINRTCPNIFVLYTLFFFLLLLFFFFSSPLFYTVTIFICANLHEVLIAILFCFFLTLFSFSFVQICTKCYLPFFSFFFLIFFLLTLFSFYDHFQ